MKGEPSSANLYKYIYIYIYIERERDPSFCKVDTESTTLGDCQFYGYGIIRPGVTDKKLTVTNTIDCVNAIKT